MVQGSLSNFKMIKCGYKANKNTLQIFYSFVSAPKDEQSKHGKGGQSGDSRRSYFERKMDEKDDRMTFSKEIIEVVLNELDMKQVDEENLSKVLGKVHDVLNQFQNICYTKGYKAAI